MCNMEFIYVRYRVNNCGTYHYTMNLKTIFGTGLNNISVSFQKCDILST